MIAPYAIPSLQGMFGMGQKGKARKMRRRAEREFDEYSIPPSSFAALEQARLAKSRNEIPGADLYRNKAMGQVAQSVEDIRRSGTAGDAAGAVTSIYGNQYMDFERDMSIRGAEMKERSRGAYTDALMYMADLETRRWEENERARYIQMMNAAGQVDEAGNQNMQSALTSGLDTYGAKWEMKNRQGMWDDKKAHELEMLQKWGEIQKSLG